MGKPIRRIIVNLLIGLLVLVETRVLQIDYSNLYYYFFIILQLYQLQCKHQNTWFVKGGRK